jgi:hypothetical protein
MTNSILDSVKKVLNLGSDYTPFDQDIIMHINSVFSALNQLGVGPESGFMIEDKDAIWSDFLGTDMRLNNIKTYVYLRVRMLFDPPTIGYLVQAMQEQIKELEWRINVQREGVAWTDPDALTEVGSVLDGGSP